MAKGILSTSPSQHDSVKPATVAGFEFITNYGDSMGTKVKHGHYRPARLYHKGSKWFVYYSFRNPDTGKMQRFKVYEGINSIADIQEKKEFGSLLIKAVNFALAGSFNPFKEIELKVAAKKWTLVQGLNYFKQQLYTRGLRKRTIQSYESIIRCAYEGLKDYLLNDIDTVTRHQVQAFLRYSFEKNKWSNTTFNNNLTFIKSIFNYLIQAEIMQNNPAAKIRPLPENITRNKYFDNDTFEKIKASAEPDLLEFILFLYHTGTRPNEARQLRYEHIHRESKLLFVPASISKNKKDDYVPLTDYVLTKYVKKEGLIFGTSVNYFTQKFNALKNKLNLPEGVNLYSVKHTRAVHLAQDGASPYAIMQLFRHNSLDMTMKYLRDLGLQVNREGADKVRL